MCPTSSRLSKANLSKLVFLNCNDKLLVQLWTSCSDKNVFLYSMNVYYSYCFLPYSCEEAIYLRPDSVGLRVF